MDRDQPEVSNPNSGAGNREGFHAREAMQRLMLQNGFSPELQAQLIILRELDRTDSMRARRLKGASPDVRDVLLTLLGVLQEKLN